MGKRKMLSIILFAIIVGFGTFYYTRHVEDFHLITTITADAVVVLLILNLSLIFCHGFQVKILTDHYKLNLNFSQWFGLSRMTNFTNLLLPFAGGAFLKAFYLKKFHKLKYNSFIASTAIATIIRLMLISLFAVALALLSGRDSIFLIAAAGAAFTGTIAFLLIGHKIQGHYFSFWSNFANLAKEWQMIREDRKMIKELILLNCLIFAISSLGIYVSFKTFSVNVSLVSSGVISAFLILSRALKLMPANLGINEAVFVAISSIYGIGMNEGLHAAVLVRIIGTIWTLVFAPLFTYKLYPEKSKPLMEKVGIKPDQAVQE